MTLVRKMTLLIALALGLSAAHAAGKRFATYHVKGRIAGQSGSYDYTAVDHDLGRVFIGRSFGVEILDLKSGRYRTLLARKGVAAVLPIGSTQMLSTNADENSATLFDRRTGKVVADIPTGSEPDGAYFEPGANLAFVSNGRSQDITVIDIGTARAIGTIAVGGAPEGTVSDGHGKLFVNLEDQNSVAVINIAARKVIGRYALPGCDEPTGITYDARTDLLISACHNRVAKLISASSGTDHGSIAIGEGADGSLFDPVRRIGFIPCIDGSLTIYTLDGMGRAKVRQTLRTEHGARTAAYDTVSDRVYLPLATVMRDAQGEYLGARHNFAVLRVERN